MMGMAIPEEYGGSGQPDYRYNVVLQEEAARAWSPRGPSARNWK
jgi:acyl-CoA dehydrogenase